MDRRAEGFDRIVEQMALEADPAETIESIMAYMGRALGSDHVGTTLVADRGRRFTSLGATSRVAGEADDSQHHLAQGPCVEAATQAGTVWSGNLGADERWSAWGPHAESLGMRSILSTELRAGEVKVGSINVYSQERDHFDAEDADLAREIARHAVVALVAANRLANTQVALQTRTVIGQAQGIVMERYQIDADAAFSVLRRYSQDQNIKLRTIAEQVIDDVGSRRPRS